MIHLRVAKPCTVSKIVATCTIHEYNNFQEKLA
jgi:hypothetical protein